MEGAKALLQLEEDEKVKTGDVRPEFTWGEAVVRYVKEKQREGKLSLVHDLIKLNWLERQVPNLRNLPLTAINRHWVDANVREPLRDIDRKPKTINSYIQVFGHILSLAATEWETEGGVTWLETAPKFKLEKIPKDQRKRVRYLTHAEASRLLAELPPHLEAMARMSVATGLRMSNVTHMKWEWIDLSRQMLIVPGDVTKGRLPIPVPLSVDALEVIRQQRFQHNVWVFPFKGQPIKQCSGRAWINAKNRAGIENFHWHDWRHTFASWHIQSGTTLVELQELGGWEDPAMVRKYAHLSVDHLRGCVENSNLSMAVNN
jgi:integrase